MPEKILIIEDDPDVAKLVSLHSKEVGFAPEVVADGAKGLALAQSGTYALIILDCMLPSLSGIEICKLIRQQGIKVPILMLTARGDEIDKVSAFELGVDDYLTKPFGVRELVARMKALLRRARGSDDEVVVMTIGDIEILPEKRRVTLRGAVLELTSKEYDLLFFLAQNPGRPYTREVLLERVWDYSTNNYAHTVTSHINRLRNKIEDNPAEPVYLLTVRGVGYRFVEASELPKK